MNQIPAENSSNERHKNAISQPASQLNGEFKN